MLQLRNAEFCRWRRHRINFCTSHVTGKEAIPCGWWMLSDRGLTQCTSKYFLCIRTFVSCTITARRYISAANHDFACTPRSMPYIFCNFSLTSLTQPHRAYYYQVRKAKRSLAKMQGELHCRFHYRVQWRVMQSNVLVAIEAQLHYMLLCDPAIVIRPVFFSFFFFFSKNYISRARRKDNFNGFLLPPGLWSLLSRSRLLWLVCEPSRSFDKLSRRAMKAVECGSNRWRVNFEETATRTSIWSQKSPYELRRTTIKRPTCSLG